MKIKINEKETTVYPVKSEDYGLMFLTGELNGLYGLNNSFIQVLKSAAGFYIGALCKDNFGTEEYPEYMWVPNFRDSQQYWLTRKETEDAFIKGDYEIKF